MQTEQKLIDLNMKIELSYVELADVDNDLYQQMFKARYTYVNKLDEFDGSPQKMKELEYARADKDELAVAYMDQFAETGP